MLRLFYTVGVVSLAVGCGDKVEPPVVNQPPTVSLTSHQGVTSFFEGDLVSFYAEVTDANDELADLSASWLVNNSVACDWAAPGEDGRTTCDIRFALTDSTLQVLVQDPEGEEATDQITFLVTATQAPSTAIISPTASGTYYSNQAIPFSAVVSDNEDDVTQLTYTVNSDLDGEIPLTASVEPDGSITDNMFLSPGQHDVTLTVFDTMDKSASTSVVIDVGEPNEAPTCAITNPSSGTILFGEMIDFAGTATDDYLNNTQLTVNWESSLDGVLDTTMPTSDGLVGFSTDALTKGSHTVTLTVTDELAGACTDSVVVAIGTPPTLSISQPIAGAIFDVGSAISFAGVVSDQEDLPQDLSLSWTSDISGEFSTQSADSNGDVAFSTNSLSNGAHQITVTATDSGGFTDEVMMMVYVNDRPSQPTVAITPNPALTEDNLVATATGSVDPDGGSITYSYKWYLNGALTSYTSDTLSSTVTTSGDIWKVRATPNDGVSDGYYAEASLIIQNTPPIVDTVTISPSSAHNKSVLTCTSNPFDPDQAVYPSYTWTINSMSYTGDTLDLSSTSGMPNDVVTCTATVSDSSGETATDSSSIVLNNQTPSIDNISISPSTVLPDSTINCTPTITDNDGETPAYTVEWFINGSSIGTVNPMSLNTTSAIITDLLTCTVVATDGYGGSATDSLTIMIGNDPPVINSITFDANAYYTNDIISASVSVSDTDTTQPISLDYEWHVIDANTGVDSLVQSGTTNTLDGAVHFDRDDTVYVIVTANDSLMDGTPVQSSSQLIWNSPPTAPSVSVAPNPALAETDDLVCSIDVESVDIDGDPVDYTYMWLDDDQAVQQETVNVTDLTDTFVGSDTTAGTWTCSVTPNDGTDDGSVGSSTVEVEGLGDGTARMTNGTFIDVTYEVCGSSCTASAAKSACSSVGKKVVSHASDGTSEVYSLGAAFSCQWSISYYTVDTQMSSSECLVGISNLEWSDCCGTSSWHGSTIPFGSPGSVFGYVNSGNSGYDSSYTNSSGSNWGCIGEGQSASSYGSCSTYYVACY